MDIKAEIAEYSYDYKDKKVLMKENYPCHAGMVKLTLEGKQMLKPQPKQKEFLLAKAKHIGFGGARGGGKSEAVRMKAKLLALRYPGIRILIVRRTYPELTNNHIRILRRDLLDIARYNDNNKLFTFANGSVIQFTYCAADKKTLTAQRRRKSTDFCGSAVQFGGVRMSLLITGMDMPSCCSGCLLSRYDDGYRGGYGYGAEEYICQLLKRYVKADTVADDCPISALPQKHGRLIDVDRLMRMLNGIEYMAYAEGGKPTFAEALEEIAKAPTVIEKEKE